MKKSIKLTVSLFICGLMLLSGCGTTSSTSLPDELRASNSGYPKSINIIAPDFFKFTGAPDAEEAKQKWLGEMSERYGVKLNVITANDYSAASNNTDSATSTLTSSTLMDFTNYVGLVSVSTDYMSTFNSRIDSGSIMPLESYLANNAIWNVLPDNFKSLFEVDGHIYAIPTSVSRNLRARVIRDDALKETGTNVTDLNSFNDFAVTYAKKAGNAAAKVYYAPEVMDILNAYGLYPGTDSYTPFSYDPTENCYVDWLTKPAAINALKYLRNLSSTGALDSTPNLAKMQATFESGIFPSAYEKYFNYDNCTEVLTLNPEYPQVLFTTASGFAMTEGTPQPQETINFLIDILFGSEQDYLECWLGSSKNYTVNSDGTITIKMIQDSKGNYVSPCMPNLAGELSDIFPYSNANLLYSKNGVVTTESKTASEKHNDRLKKLDESLKNGTTIEIPPEYQFIKSATYNANLLNNEENNICIEYVLCFLQAIRSSDKTVQQIIDEYKAEMLDAGGNQMLDEMNAAIGKKTAYYYG